MTATDAFWEEAEKDLAGLAGKSGLNIAHEACDHHVLRGEGSRIAIRWLGTGGEERDITYAGLSEASDRFANILRGLGIGRGGKVFTLLGRVPERHITALGTWKCGAVFCPLFSAFGPEPVKARMLIAKPAAVVTSNRHYLRKIKPILGDLPFLKHVILTDGGEEGLSLAGLMREAAAEPHTEVMTAEDLAILHFTSGQTQSTCSMIPRDSRAR